MKNLLEIINNILIENNIQPINEINDETDLRDDIGFDSFMLAKLTVDIEDEYGVDVFENGIIRKIREIKKYLNE
jgi:acyl carrier protein